MSSATEQIQAFTQQDYKYGFVTEIETDSVPAGLSEDVIRLISAKKSEPKFMLEWRLKAYRHWLKMEEPAWANVRYPPIDYQSIVYYSAPKAASGRPKSLDEVDPEILETFEKLGIPLQERVTRINQAISGPYGPPGVKAAMTLAGFRGGIPRRPLLPLTAEQTAAMREMLAKERLL